jgi:hypothetical protein
VAAALADHKARGILSVHSLLAYIDPGSGSLIIQAVIATALAVPFFLREQIGRLFRSLRRDKPNDRTS